MKSFENLQWKVTRCSVWGQCGLGATESCCALLTFLKGVWYPAHPNLVHNHRFPLLHSGCILSYFQDGKLGLVQNECCHYTTEYCKKRRNLCLLDWGWRKINVFIVAWLHLISPRLCTLLPSWKNASSKVLPYEWCSLIVHRSSRSQLFPASLLL